MLYKSLKFTQTIIIIFYSYNLLLQNLFDEKLDKKVIIKPKTFRISLENHSAFSINMNILQKKTQIEHIKMVHSH